MSRIEKRSGLTCRCRAQTVRQHKSDCILYPLELQMKPDTYYSPALASLLPANYATVKHQYIDISHTGFFVLTVSLIDIIG